MNQTNMANERKIAPEPTQYGANQTIVHGTPIQQAASQDSEEGNNNNNNGSNSSSAGSSRNELDQATGRNELRMEQQLINNGHQDPTQRKIYLGLLGFSILNALIGLVLILVWKLKYSAVTGFGISDAGLLSNLHVLLMYTFMVSLNMYTVLIYRTHYSLAKKQLKWAHAILSGTNMIMALLGVAAMFKAHLMLGLANFYSLHSWIGSMTNAFYVSQFTFGFVAFLKPGMSEHRRKQIMPWHRRAGAALLVLAATAAITGIAELVIFQTQTSGDYQAFTPITFIANFAGVSVILMTATSIYLLTESQYLRPALPEEMPIKR